MIHNAQGGLQEAIAYATEALPELGNSDALHESFLVASGGYNGDFKNRNHRKLIEYYTIFCKLYPDSYVARKILILNLLDDYRLEEAEVEIRAAMKNFPITATNWRFITASIASGWANKKGETDLEDDRDRGR